MKVKVLRSFVYDGKDCFESATVDVAEKDVISLARRGLIEIVKEKQEIKKNKE